MQTLVVTPSFKRNTINAKKSLPSTSAHHLIQPKKTRADANFSPPYGVNEL
jgi:hypothetical protein